MASALKKAAQARRAKKGGVDVRKNYSPQSFSFKGSGRSAAYKAAARSALKAGKSVIAAARAGSAADRRAAPRGKNSSQGNSP